MQAQLALTELALRRERAAALLVRPCHYSSVVKDELSDGFDRERATWLGVLLGCLLVRQAFSRQCRLACKASMCYN